MTELDEAVAALTEPVITMYEGRYVVQDALLTQLENAKYSNTNHGSGGGSKSGRSVLNSDAMELAAHIHVEAQSWVRIAGLKPRRETTIEALNRWAAHVTDAGEFYLTQLATRRQQIVTMLNPLGKFEFDAICPVGKCATYEDAEGVIRPRPIIATYPKDDVQRIRMVCRSCDASWEGEGVADLIEETETREE